MLETCHYADDLDAAERFRRVAESSLGEWRDRFEAVGLAIEAEIHWPRGGTSLYVRDSAGNCVELAPARIWDISG